METVTSKGLMERIYVLGGFFGVSPMGSVAGPDTEMPAAIMVVKERKSKKLFLITAQELNDETPIPDAGDIYTFKKHRLN
jgi:hypothetical protein